MREGRDGGVEVRVSEDAIKDRRLEMDVLGRVIASSLPTKTMIVGATEGEVFVPFPSTSTQRCQREDPGGLAHVVVWLQSFSVLLCVSV